MRQKTIRMVVSLIVVTLGHLALTVGKASAETVLEKINRTGKFTAGTRTSSIPFAYINEKNEWVGFSVDLLNEINNRLNRNLIKKVTLELKEVTPKTRIALVANRTVDIECGSTTYTRSRDETVDFSVNFFYTGSQLLVKKGSDIKNLRDLRGKRVGATQGTTNERILRTRQPQAKIVVFQDHAQGFLALQQGRGRSTPTPRMEFCSPDSPPRPPIRATLKWWETSSAKSPTRASCRKTTPGGVISSITPLWN